MAATVSWGCEIFGDLRKAKSHRDSKRETNPTWTYLWHFDYATSGRKVQPPRPGSSWHQPVLDTSDLMPTTTSSSPEALARSHPKHIRNRVHDESQCFHYLFLAASPSFTCQNIPLTDLLFRGPDVLVPATAAKLQMASTKQHSNNKPPTQIPISPNSLRKIHLGIVPKHLPLSGWYLVWSPSRCWG